MFVRSLVYTTFYYKDYVFVTKDVNQTSIFFSENIEGKSRSAILLESRIQAIRELCLVLVESMSVIVRVHVCYWLFPCLLLVESMSVIGCFHVCNWLSPCLLLVESMSVIKDT